MTWLEQRLSLAHGHLGHSVVRINPHLAEDALSKLQNPRPALVGFKDDPELLASPVLERLRAHQDHLWLTVDRAAPGLRSIDPDLANPLTGLPMTGSSSGTAANVFENMVDVGIGTDSGGSVLGPALSVHCYGMIAGGLGLTGAPLSASSCPTSLGVIARDLPQIRQTLAAMAGQTPDWLLSEAKTPCTIGYPAPGSLRLPSDIDSGQVVEEVLGNRSHQMMPVSLSDPMDRERIVEDLLPVLAAEVDVFVAFEGPVNVFSSADARVGTLGATGRALRQRNGRHVLRAANRLTALAISVPAIDLCSGFVVIGQATADGARTVLELASELTNLVGLCPD